jgi:O-antigen ligase
MTDSTIPWTPRTQAAGRPGSLFGGLLIGLVVGAVLVELFLMELRFTIYGLIGLVGLTFLPMVVRRVGSLDRLLLMAVVLAVQMEVAWAPLFWGQKVAGPYGILISPMLMAAAALFLLRFWRYGVQLSIDRQLVRWSVLMFVAGVISVVHAPDKHLVMYGLFEIGTIALIAFVVCEQCARPDGVRTVEQCLDWTLVLQSLLIIAMFATGVQISLSHWVGGGGYAESGRYAGTLGTPSVVASILVVCLLSLVARIVEAPAGPRRVWMGCQLVLGIFAVLLTQTRSAWIGLVLGSGGIGWSLVRRGRMRPQQLIGLLGLVALAFLIALPFISGRVEASHGNDAEVRWNLILLAWEMIKAHPLAGLGLNCATQVVYAYAALAGVAGAWVFIPHNQFMLVFAETGLLGFVSFVALFKVSLRPGWSALQASDPVLRSAGSWVFWSLVVMIQMLNLDHVSGANTYKLVFMLFGIACGLGYQIRAQQLDAAGGAGMSREARA